MGRYCKRFTFFIWDIRHEWVINVKWLTFVIWDPRHKDSLETKIYKGVLNK